MEIVSGPDAASLPGLSRQRPPHGRPELLEQDFELVDDRALDLAIILAVQASTRAEKKAPTQEGMRCAVERSDNLLSELFFYLIILVKDLGWGRTITQKAMPPALSRGNRGGVHAGYVEDERKRRQGKKDHQTQTLRPSTTAQPQTKVSRIRPTFAATRSGRCS